MDSVEEVRITSVDPQKLDAFLGRAVNDMGAAMSGLLVVVGDRLGLYKAMAHAGPLTPAELGEDRHDRAHGAGVAERPGCVRLCHLRPRDRSATNCRTSRRTLANEDSPAYVLGVLRVAMRLLEPKITEAFRTGRRRLARARPGCVRGRRAVLPARLRRQPGAVVDPRARRRRGQAASGRARSPTSAAATAHRRVILAQAYPNSTFVGFDYHGPSIDAARRKRRAAGVADNCTFEVAAAKDYPGHDYDLVAHFDCLHDMGDPRAPPRTCCSRSRPTERG